LNGRHDSSAVLIEPGGCQKGHHIRRTRRSDVVRPPRPPRCNLACDQQGRPLSVVITSGQRRESTQVTAVLDGIRVPGGRFRKRPSHVIADKGYSYPACRQLLRRRGIRHTIPERCVNILEQWRGIATRYEKCAVNLTS